MIWQKDVLIKYKKEIIQSAIISFIMALVFLLYTYSIGNTFVWQSISPFEAPSILNKIFYTAFTFSTIGAFCYYVLKFWEILHFICVDIFNNKGLYYVSKKVFWLGLLAVSYFYIVPTFINVLNKITSFFFNAFNFLLYISPFLGIFLILSVIVVYTFIKFKKEPNIIKD